MTDPTYLYKSHRYVPKHWFEFSMVNHHEDFDMFLRNQTSWMIYSYWPYHEWEEEKALSYDSYCILCFDESLYLTTNESKLDKEENKASDFSLKRTPYRYCRLRKYFYSITQSTLTVAILLINSMTHHWWRQVLFIRYHVFFAIYYTTEHESVFVRQ